jgi:hypothetical protein
LTGPPHVLLADDQGLVPIGITGHSGRDEGSKITKTFFLT